MDSNLFSNLFKWIKTFDSIDPCDALTDLTSGVVLSQVLAEISPTYFSEEWRSRINKDVEDNPILKRNNLKKILNGMLDYYSDALGHDIHGFTLPDLGAIVETNSEVDMGRLLQLILSCAVNCDDKHNYIQKIMAMEEGVQHAVMEAIQDLMNRDSQGFDSQAENDYDRQLQKSWDEIQRLTLDNEDVAQKCHELDQQVVLLIDEKSVLMGEVERLQEKLNLMDCDDPNSSTGRRLMQLQNKIEELTAENYRLEAAKDDYRTRVEITDKENEDLQFKIDELQGLAKEAKILKDEMDIMRHNNDKLMRYEAVIESYKKKMEEMSDLKRQLKLLEDKNATYMDSHLQLEEEVRRVNPLRTQLESYKRQIADLQATIASECKRADRAELDLKKSQDKVTHLTAEKRRIVLERDGLKETNEELRFTQFHQDVPSDDSPRPLSITPTLDNVPTDIREKLFKLQQENRILKNKVDHGFEEKVHLLENQLEDENRRRSDLETDLKLANRRIVELESELDDLKEIKLSESEIQMDTDLKNKIHEYMEKYRTADAELQKKKSNMSEMERKHVKINDELTQVKERLTKKEQEMHVMEEKYKKYLEKAKSVIKTLDPRHNPGITPELHSLRAKLQEKEKLIEALEQEREKMKANREAEEKLIVTAWYNMGMQLHRKAAEDRLSNSGVGQSFLARQRQASSRRNVPIAAGAGSSRFLPDDSGATEPTLWPVPVKGQLQHQLYHQPQRRRREKDRFKRSKSESNLGEQPDLALSAARQALPDDKKSPLKMKHSNIGNSGARTFNRQSREIAKKMWQNVLHHDSDPGSDVLSDTDSLGSTSDFRSAEVKKSQAKSALVPPVDSIGKEVAIPDSLDRPQRQVQVDNTDQGSIRITVKINKRAKTRGKDEPEP